MVTSSKVFFKEVDFLGLWIFIRSIALLGGYSLYEPDGTKRIVEYVADKHHGFNAVVKKVGHAHHPQHYGVGGGIANGGGLGVGGGAVGFGAY